MKFLLDTCTVSYFVQGDAKVVSRLHQSSPATLVMSSVTVMEIEYGIQWNTKRGKLLAPVLQRLFDSITLLPYGIEDARATASLRAALKKRGRPIGPFDLMIAGTALSRGLILVTSNTSEFRHVGGLVLEDWRK